MEGISEVEPFMPNPMDEIQIQAVEEPVVTPTPESEITPEESTDLTMTPAITEPEEVKPTDSTEAITEPVTEPSLN